MYRTPARHALVPLLLAALAAPLCPSVPAHAQAAPAAVVVPARVQEINMRRRALTMQLTKQRLELTRSGQRELAVRTRLEAPENAADKAPEARTLLLDEATDQLETIIYLAGQFQAGAAELAELEDELGALVADAEAAVTVAAADPTPRGRMAKLKALQYANTLKLRAQLGAPALATARRDKRDQESAACHAAQSEAEQRLVKVAAEPRFAQLSETPPRTVTTRPGKLTLGAPLKACAVREVDWKNVTISVAGQSMLLIDGQGPILPQRGPIRANVTLRQVDFADSDGDGREEALLLVDREEYAPPPGSDITSNVDVLYAFASTPDCGLRRLGAVELASGGRGGKPVAGGYEYQGKAEFRDYRWVDGRLKEVAVRPLKKRFE